MVFLHFEYVCLSHLWREGVLLRVQDVLCPASLCYTINSTEPSNIVFIDIKMLYSTQCTSHMHDSASTNSIFVFDL